LPRCRPAQGVGANRISIFLASERGSAPMPLIDVVVQAQSCAPQSAGIPGPRRKFQMAKKAAKKKAGRKKAGGRKKMGGRKKAGRKSKK
jgi:hypothetical protein